MFQALNRSMLPTALLMTALCLAGCGESGPPRYDVEGSVTFDGAPIENGSIAFIPTGTTVGPSAGAPITNGDYKTLPGKGPVAGSYKVEIKAYRKGKSLPVVPIDGPKSGPTGSASSTETQTIEMFIPARYNTSTTLTLDVLPTKNKKDFPLTGG